MFAAPMKLVITLTCQACVRMVLLQKSSWSRIGVTEITEQNLIIWRKSGVGVLLPLSVTLSFLCEYMGLSSFKPLTVQCNYSRHTLEYLGFSLTYDQFSCIGSFKWRNPIQKSRLRLMMSNHNKDLTATRLLSPPARSDRSHLLVQRMPQGFKTMNSNCPMLLRMGKTSCPNGPNNDVG